MANTTSTKINLASFLFHFNGLHSISVDSSGLCIETVPWSAVDDAQQAGLLANLEVGATSLVDKLKGLSLVEEIALLEMVERRG